MSYYVHVTSQTHLENQPETPSPPVVCRCGLSAVCFILGKLSPCNPSCSILNLFSFPRSLQIPTWSSEKCTSPKFLTSLPYISIQIQTKEPCGHFLSVPTLLSLSSVIIAPSCQTAARINTSLTQANIRGGG